MNAPEADKKNRKNVIIGVAVAVVALGSYLTYQHFEYVDTDNAQIDAHSVMLAAKVTGFVIDVKVVEGQKVKIGDVLAEIDPRDYQNTLTQIKGELTSIQARRKDAEHNFNRLSELYPQGAVSQQQFDTALASYSEVKAKYDAVAAQVAQAELNLDNTKIKAPDDGFIAKKSIERGQLTAPGVPLFGFIDSKERWATANFKETEISSVKVGAKVDVTVDAVDDKKFHGVVESISAATGSTFTLLPPDNATGNFTKVVQRVPVKIQLKDLTEEDIEKLRAGLSAVVKVHR